MGMCAHVCVQDTPEWPGAMKVLGGIEETAKQSLLFYGRTPSTLQTPQTPLSRAPVRKEILNVDCLLVENVLQIFLKERLLDGQQAGHEVPREGHIW
jgi:hypothetical protein